MHIVGWARAVGSCKSDCLACWRPRLRARVGTISKTVMILFLAFVAIQCVNLAFTALEGWEVTESFLNSFCLEVWGFKTGSHVV